MARPKEVIDDALALKAKQELANIKDHQLAIRLQAIISAAAHPIGTVASIMGYNRQTIWRWIRQFKANGIDGIIDKPKGHNPSKLDEEQRRQVEGWLRDGKNARGEPVHWTLEKLSIEIEKELGVRLTKTPIWLMIRSMGFRQKVPRPSHAKANKEAQQAFKKNCRDRP